MQVLVGKIILNRSIICINYSKKLQ